MKELIKILDELNFSPLHDYDKKDDYISMLGIFEDDVILLDCVLPKGWIIVEKRRNPDNDFLRVDIVKSK